MNNSNQRTLLKERFALKNVDRFLHNLHSNRSRLNKILTIGGSLIIYAAVILLFGNRLKVSSNYFIVIPLIAFSFSFGFAGGIAAGISALPLNLLMFKFLGHPEYSPESKLIAEITGIVVGTVLGYLSDYYYEIEAEIALRREAEEKLQQSLEEKELLFQEIHHRVKNNLNIIKSLIQLQINRSDDPNFRDEAEKLIKRIYSISRVHERLYRGNNVISQRLDEYVPEIINEILAGIEDGAIEVNFSIEIPEIEITTEQATSIGLIINEVLTNAVKYSLSLVESPRFDIALKSDEKKTVIELKNNAPTFVPAQDDYSGLGLKLIKILSEQMNASYEYLPGNGTTFRLILPERILPKNI